MLAPPIAADQGGTFTRRQALEAGLSPKTIRRRIDDRAWIEWIPQGFRLAGAKPGTLDLARLATELTRSVASHLTAATILRIDDGLPPGDDVIHITTPTRRHENLAHLAEHRLPLDARDSELIAGVPITTRVTTVLDLVSWLPERQARAYFFRCIQQQWITPVEFIDGLERRRGRHGIQRLRSFADYLGTGAHSGGEHALHLILRRGGIAFHANVSVRPANGPTCVVDVLLDEAPVVIELDGRRFHADAVTFQRDRTRQNHLVNGGYVVLRVTVEDVVDRPDEVLRTVLDAVTSTNLRSSTRRF